MTDQFACKNVPPRGYNKSRFCDPALDKLLTGARTVYPEQQRRPIYAQIQKTLSEQLPIALLYQRREIDAFTTRLHGQTASVSSIFWDAGSWYLTK